MKKEKVLIGLLTGGLIITGSMTGLSVANASYKTDAKSRGAFYWDNDGDGKADVFITSNDIDTLFERTDNSVKVRYRTENGMPTVTFSPINADKTVEAPDDMEDTDTGTDTGSDTDNDASKETDDPDSGTKDSDSSDKSSSGDGETETVHSSTKTDTQPAVSGQQPIVTPRDQGSGN